jgi:branched-chain amino acid transport system ATP-binding protein
MSLQLLMVDQVTCRFRGVVAVDAVSFSVTRGTVHGLIGPNGAGKTTLFNLLSGLVQPEAGKILLDGTPLTGLPSFRRAKLGLARTFQNIRMFSQMTVLENVMTGMHARRLPERHAKERAFDHLEFVGLHDLAWQRAGELSYGDQRRLEIARALAAEPKLLLLDEPAAGMNPAETQMLVKLLGGLEERGITLLLVEHDMHFVMNLCDRITVLSFGRKIAEGSPREVRENPQVVEAYLGTKLANRLAGTPS